MCLDGVAVVPADVISVGLLATASAAASEGEEEKMPEPPRLYYYILSCEDLAAIYSKLGSAESCCCRDLRESESDPVLRRINAAAL